MSSESHGTRGQDNTGDERRNQSEIGHAIEELRHLLPMQGPIEVFIHHNTLHSFEHLDFETAVERAGEIYGARPYLAESRYRSLFLDGAIRRSDIDLELAPFLKDDIDILPGKLTRKQLRRRLLLWGFKNEEEAISRWKQAEGELRLRSDIDAKMRRSLIEETKQWVIGLHGGGRDSFITDLQSDDSTKPNISHSELATFIHGSDLSAAAQDRADAIAASILWHCASKAAHLLPVKSAAVAPHHAEALRQITGVDLFELIDPLLIQLSSAFIDQGVSHWPMPGREVGFLAVVESLLSTQSIPSEPWIKRAEQLMRSLRSSEIGAEKALGIVLEQLGVEHGSRAHYVVHGGLHLKGWAGFFSLIETKPATARDRPVNASLIEFLTVQHIFILAAAQEIAASHDIPSITLADVRRMAHQRERAHHVDRERRRMTQVIFEVVQLIGLSPRELIEGGADLAQLILGEVESFPATVRQRIWQMAYERSYLDSLLTAFGSHKVIDNKGTLSSRTESPDAQVMFCIDEREESIRRHLEEINPRVETLGYPGFFNLPLAYRGIHHLHAEALCPVVMEPQIAVSERDRSSRAGRRDNLFKRLLGSTSQDIQSLTHTSVGGSVISTLLGHFALVPFIMRVLQPALAGRVHDAFHTPEIRDTDFKITAANGAVSDEDLRKSIAQSLASVFKVAGVATRTAPLIVIMGHGSSSLNNPHESAHDCGACGGRRGAPSARLFARFANDPLIRAEMHAAGVTLSPETYVVGAYHDTCDDSVTVFDEQLIPEHQRERATKILRDCREASARNALERSRRFLTARHDLSPTSAAASLVRRSEDFSEPRPEYGHATNANAFIGRRSRCAGLFLDRRSFLSSYDPTQDPDGKLLQSLLAAVVPVCTGINLEYYFSMVDSTAYGCGTKLPHNIVGQIGVMDGSSSDLRTGLPWQMVEIHEPVRLVMIVDTTPKILSRILENLPRVKSLVQKRWFWLVAFDPNTSEFSLYRDGEFHPYPIARRDLPRITDSLSYCVHTSKPLPFASVVGKAEASL